MLAGSWQHRGATGDDTTAYTGPCNITVANTVINAKIVNCDLTIRAANVMITRSEIHGMIDGQEGTSSSFLLQDSLVSNRVRR